MKTWFVLFMVTLAILAVSMIPRPKKMWYWAVAITGNKANTVIEFEFQGNVSAALIRAMELIPAEGGDVVIVARSR